MLAGTEWRLQPRGRYGIGAGARRLFNDLPMRCRAERELLAYNLTLEWLREQGAPDPHAVLDIDDFTILIRAMCPDG